MKIHVETCSTTGHEYVVSKLLRLTPKQSRGIMPRVLQVVCNPTVAVRVEPGWMVSDIVPRVYLFIMYMFLMFAIQLQNRRV